MGLVLELVATFVAEILGDGIGRRAQAARARRRAARGLVTCALRDPAGETNADRRWVRGAAEVGYRRLRLDGCEYAVDDVDAPGRTIPADAPDGDGPLWFSPATRIVDLATSNGPVEWALLDWQADWALERLRSPGA